MQLVTVAAAPPVPALTGVIKVVERYPPRQGSLHVVCYGLFCCVLSPHPRCLYPDPWDPFFVLLGSRENGDSGEWDSRWLRPVGLSRGRSVTIPLYSLGSAQTMAVLACYVPAQSPHQASASWVLVCAMLPELCSCPNPTLFLVWFPESIVSCFLLEIRLVPQSSVLLNSSDVSFPSLPCSSESSLWAPHRTGSQGEDATSKGTLPPPPPAFFCFG